MKINAITPKAINNTSKKAAPNTFKGAYAVRGTNEEIAEFNEQFHNEMKSSGGIGTYRMYYYGPRLSPKQPQSDLFIATGKEKETLQEFLDEQITVDKLDLENHKFPPAEIESEEFSLWYLKQTDKTMKKLREKFGTPIHILSASRVLKAINKGMFDFNTGEINK